MHTQTRPEIITSTFSTAENPEFIENLQQQGLLNNEGDPNLSDPQELTFLHRQGLSQELYRFRHNEGNFNMTYENVRLSRLDIPVGEYNYDEASYILQLNGEIIELRTNLAMQNQINSTETPPIRFINNLLNSSNGRSLQPVRNPYDRQTYIPSPQSELIRNPGAEENLIVMGNNPLGFYNLTEYSGIRETATSVILGQQDTIERESNPQFRSTLERRFQFTNYECIFRTIDQLRLMTNDQLCEIMNYNQNTIGRLNQRS